eukprot:COSAG03_NODE_13032_length_520_cov_0.969121_2_plen_65_part_01
MSSASCVDGARSSVSLKAGGLVAGASKRERRSAHRPSNVAILIIPAERPSKCLRGGEMAAGSPSP